MKRRRLLAHRQYWDDVVQKIESETLKEKNDNFIRVMNYSVTLPAKLRKRVEKVIPYIYEEDDQFGLLNEKTSATMTSITEVELSDAADGYDDDQKPEDRQRQEDRQMVAEAQQQQRELVFTESKCSQISRMEHDFPHTDVRIERPSTIAEKVIPDENWMSNYVCKQRQDRVVWNSVLYPQEKTFYKMSPSDQADFVMDTCSTRFAKWINSLGNDPAKFIPGSLIKQLFNIEPEKSLTNSLRINPKEVKAIAKQIALKWNVPKMALETKYANVIRRHCRVKTTKVKRHAFGRTIPARELPWRPTYTNRPIKTFFPNELLSGELLFKGIGHLRTVKRFIDFCVRNPVVQKPKFLVQCGHFKKSRVAALSIKHLPLYERLNLKY